MKKLKQKIINSLGVFPDFDELFANIDIASNKGLTNGVRLDAAKCTLESISKTMLGYLNRSLSRKQLSAMKFAEAIRFLIEEISRRGEKIEADFVTNITNLNYEFGRIRNEKGDLSHGHIIPKNNISNSFTEMIVDYTEISCVYLLNVFMGLDLSYELAKPYDSEENSLFNDYLDELNNPIGKVSYSKALYDLDYDAYTDAQDRYNNEL